MKILYVVYGEDRKIGERKVAEMRSFSFFGDFYCAMGWKSVKIDYRKQVEESWLKLFYG